MLATAAAGLGQTGSVAIRALCTTCGVAVSAAVGVEEGREVAVGVNVSVGGGSVGVGFLFWDVGQGICFFVAGS